MLILPRRLFAALQLLGLVVTAASWVVRQWSIARTEADMEAASAVLGPWIAGDDVRRLETASGLSAIEHPELPQVSAPDWVYDGSAPPIGWAAYEVDRSGAEPAVGPDVRGIVVTCQADGTLALDQLTAFLPEPRRARTPEEVGWIAFARYREETVLWVMGSAASTLAVERIDLRVVARDDGRRIGRVTAEGAPPLEVRDPNELFQPGPATVVRAILDLLEDPEPAPTVVLRADELSCPADVMPEGLAADLDVPRGCELGATTECVAACTGGDAGACLAAARTMEHGWTLAARRLFRLACLAGSIEGCTRDAELRLRAAPAPSAEETACAQRVFERTCAAGDRRACALMPSVE